MTDAAITAAPGRGDRLTPLLFALAIFTSASLVFVVQPMVAKLVLPMLGGSPSVWNTSMVFFQAALLGGYAYAHALQRIGSIRLQVGVHLALLLLAALFLPLKISGLLGDPDPSAPIGWLLLTLTLSVGAPFAVLSATAPLLQAWYARVRAGHEDGKNPYVLYAASNLGSFLALLLLAALFLPLKISGLLGDPDPSAPIGWLLLTLTLSVGAPFAVLSATAPLLQAWYARVRAGHEDGKNPYVLYAASNLGSFLALLSYPLLIEPLATLGGQRGGWSIGYGVFILMIAALAVVVWRSRDAADEPPPLAPSAPIVWLDKLKLVLLAAAPSSLMLGVTAHLSTDVASAPFLWVVPLALYLLTFVIAFQAKPLIPIWLTLMVQGALVAACIMLVAFRTGNWPMLFAIHLATFFFTALMCHQLLAERRPAPDRLTEFYLLMSLGGVVGGAFTALLAPVIFNSVWEYPLVLVLVALARPMRRTPVERNEIILFVVGLVIAVTPPILSAAFQADWDFARSFNDIVPLDMQQLSIAILGMAAVCAFLLRDRTPAFVILIGAMALSSHYIARGYDARLSDRSFFGVMKVAETEDPRLGGPVHVLMHGTTLHGAQPRGGAMACTPTLYYAPATPIGQATLAQRDKPGAVIGVVGLGTGALAGYKRATDALTFFEIDPLVDRLARDPEWFTFISDCADGPVRTVLGDARLTLGKEARGTYDLLVIDAFSSDAVPTHLLTEEAIQLYLSLLKPDGVVLLHLSNRNLEITLPAQAAAQSLRVPALHQIYVESDGAPEMAEASTEALILSPTEAGLAKFRADGRWNQLQETQVRPWTDDYVNLVGSLWRHMTR